VQATAAAEISFADGFSGTAHEKVTSFVVKPTQATGSASTSKACHPSSEISTFQVLDEAADVPGSQATAVPRKPKSKEPSESESARQHHEIPWKSPEGKDTAENEDEGGIDGTWCWEVCSHV
jgi:hypothetical protein